MNLNTTTTYTIIVIVLFLFFSCSSNNEKENKNNQYEYGKGISLEKESDYLTMKMFADNAYSFIIDTCLKRNQLLLIDYVKITPKMYQLVKYSGFQNTCEIVEEQIGLIEHKELFESFYVMGKILRVFRYKLQCKKIKDPIELRIILTDSNKLTEYRFFEWQDEYREDIIKMNWF